MFRNRSVDISKFATVPANDVPRSRFEVQSTLKTTFDAGYLIPIYMEEVLPGDTFNLKMTSFTRLSTPLYPTMDNLTLDSFFFFVPNRLLWDNWRQFMGQENSDGTFTDYVPPTTTSPIGGYNPCTIFDYMGLPIKGQIASDRTLTHNVFHLRAYNLIFNEWFRDEFIAILRPVNRGNGPDTYTDYALCYRGKRRDYFTGCLPWPQFGQTLESDAPAIHLENRYFPVTTTNTQIGVAAYNDGATPTLTGNLGIYSNNQSGAPNSIYAGFVNPSVDQLQFWGNTGLHVDFGNERFFDAEDIRSLFAIQRWLEKEARGGARYVETIRSHFGVISPDARQQRPEYIGGGSTPVNINPVAQTSATAATGTNTPLATLGGMGTAVTHDHGFTYSATEHGVFLGLVNVRADQTYQQGMDRMWSRKHKYDYYWPSFAHLGEQAVLNKEIYTVGWKTGLTPAQDTDETVFGYQERYAEYRYKPSMITGYFRSTTTGTLDAWHYAEKFTSLPNLTSAFILSKPPIARTLATANLTAGQQFLFDGFFDIKMVRPLPMYGTPGLVDHF